MKVGLYFGSFNPIHHGHLLLASYFLEEGGLDQIWFVVSPQNPLKPAAGLLNEYHRLHLVRLATDGEPRLKPSDIEFKLPRPSYTVDTLAYLSEKYPQHDFIMLLGSDSLQNLAKWKNFSYILKHFPIYVYLRQGYEHLPEFEEGNIRVFSTPYIPISATHIRENIKSGRSIRYLVPDKVLEEIERNGYYQ